MKWAAYSPAHGWVVDLCVGLLYTWKVAEATEFDSPLAIDEAFKAADLSPPSTMGIVVVRIR
jgi:hypothetical protein